MASTIGTFETPLNAVLWGQLKNEVPHGVLGLRYEMKQIEEGPLRDTIQTLFDRLIKVLTPLFNETGMAPKLTLDSCTQLQERLLQKWGDEAFLTIWKNGKLRQGLKSIGSLKGQGPQSLQEIRAWMRNKPERLDRVSWLDLKNLGLKICPQELSAFHDLSFLNLSNNQLKYFNLDLSKMPKLHTLIINDNQLSLFSSNLTPCAALKFLSLKRNRLTDFSVALTQAIELSHLDLAHNRLKSLSCDLSRCTQLFMLDLSFNRIEDFRLDLTQYPRLCSLYLSHNQLMSFSADLSRSTNLNWFDISGNRISAFNSDLSQCVNLSLLNISYNKISTFDSDLSDCKHLYQFYYHGNPIPSSTFENLKHKPWVQVQPFIDFGHP